MRLETGYPLRRPADALLTLNDAFVSIDVLHDAKSPQQLRVSCLNQLVYVPHRHRAMTMMQLYGAVFIIVFTSSTAILLLHIFCTKRNMYARLLTLCNKQDYKR